MIDGLGSLVIAAGALAAVLALIVLAARVVRISGWAPRMAVGKRLVVRESVALDARRRLHLVQCGDREVVLLTGSAQDLVVGWIGERGPMP